MDPRREHNKVRMQLAGKPSSGSRERSPYGTPKSGRSPLESPLVGNASQVPTPPDSKSHAFLVYAKYCHPKP